jgi:hypothetical protein
MKKLVAVGILGSLLLGMQGCSKTESAPVAGTTDAATAAARHDDLSIAVDQAPEGGSQADAGGQPPGTKGPKIVRQFSETGSDPIEGCNEAKGRVPKAIQRERLTVASFGKCSCTKKAEFVYSCSVEANLYQLTTGS